MKELLTQYAQYNIWANKLMSEALLSIDQTLIDEELVSSFPTLRMTMYHCWSAEHIWLQRMAAVENPEWLQDKYKGSFEEACRLWSNTSERLLQLVTDLPDDAACTKTARFFDYSGNEHNMPLYEILQHVFNHNSYHRGQLVTMLRQVGLTTIPRTDFIAFARLK